MKINNIIVVGSGCSGSMVSQTLVEAGESVHMLDGGVTKTDDLSVPDREFLQLRRNDKSQYKYLIGNHARNIPWGQVGKGAQITPPREYMTKHTEKFLKFASDNFSPFESLGYGGLGIGWGLQCWQFSKKEIEAVGMNPDEIFKAYEVVSSRIGISATQDDASPYTINQLKHFLPSTHMDRNHSLIYKKYLKKRKEFQRNNYFLGRTPLALLTKDQDGRHAYKYKGMDFYTDNSLSSWRPWMTINHLKKSSRFKYTPSLVVTHFKEKKGYTEVFALNIETKEQEMFLCRKLILACGTIGSARIAIRSQADPSKTKRVPLLCNPYTYVPSVQPMMFGKGSEAGKMGFGQLSLFHDPNHDDFDLSIATTYSYQSLMMFRLIRQLPLNFRDARDIMRFLMPGLIIVGIQHPDARSSQKYLELKEDPESITGDYLHASYKLSEAERTTQNDREKGYIKMMHKLGVHAVTKMNPGHGSSVHYAGTLPFSDTEAPLTLSRDGRLHTTKSVFVADSSGFKYLPARGLTFTILANAHVTAQNILQHG